MANSTLERRLRKIEGMMSAPPCPVHGKPQGIYFYCSPWDDEQGRKDAEAKRAELSECPHCCEQNPIIIVFQSFKKPQAEPIHLGERESFSFDLPEAAPDMPVKITFAKWQRDELN